VMPAACCGMDGERLELNDKDLLSSKLARGDSGASCQQSTGLPAVTL
jgi:hypothetical protein